jgi:hypothetical protein
MKMIGGSNRYYHYAVCILIPAFSFKIFNATALALAKLVSANIPSGPIQSPIMYRLSTPGISISGLFFHHSIMVINNGIENYHGEKKTVHYNHFSPSQLNHV